MGEVGEKLENQRTYQKVQHEGDASTRSLLSGWKDQEKLWVR